MIYHRWFDTYAEYEEVQGTKARTQREKLLATTRSRQRAFIQRFLKFKNWLNMGPILCLGARTGCEVKAARTCGYIDSIGVDLHPIGDLVIKGDWHDLPFGDGSFRNAYCNSLDHCLNFQEFKKEVDRVLSSNGVFIYESHTHYALDSRLPNDPLDIQAIVNGTSNRNSLNAMWLDSLTDIANEFWKDGYTYLGQINIGEKYTAHAVRKP